MESFGAANSVDDHSSAVTLEKHSILFNLACRFVDTGGLKFHCWRTIPLSELSPFGDLRKTESKPGCEEEVQHQP
jgi:hypothetical protein